MNSIHSKKTCTAPWSSLAINVDKTVSLCAHTFGEIQLGSWNTHSLKDILNNYSSLKIRDEFQNKVKQDACKVCYTLEEIGQNSNRNDFIKNLPRNLDKREIPVSDIKALKIFLSNKCNLSCRTCSSYFSSSWNEDDKKLNRETQNFQTLSDSQLNEALELSKNISYLYLAGGEPLVHKETFLLLDNLSKNNKSCAVTINTNLSKLTYLDHSLLESAKDLDNIRVNLSIDGVGSRGEYIRNKLNFTEFTNNISTVVKSNIKTSFVITISNLNIFYLDEILEYILDIVEDKEFDIIFNFVNYPYHYDIRILPQKVKTLIQAEIYSMMLKYRDHPKGKLFIKNIHSIKEYLFQDCDKSNLTEFFKETELVDKIRSQSFAELFSDSFNILSRYK
jgi:MoaA/NifB/PqqE/SkfB family radical SAM enzyme